jgi:hypothetical protein
MKTLRISSLGLLTVVLFLGSLGVSGLSTALQPAQTLSDSDSDGDTVCDGGVDVTEKACPANHCHANTEGTDWDGDGSKCDPALGETNLAAWPGYCYDCGYLDAIDLCPLHPPPVCGDGVCSIECMETCESCPQDCYILVEGQKTCPQGHCHASAEGTDWDGDGSKCDPALGETNLAGWPGYCYDCGYLDAIDLCPLHPPPRVWRWGLLH